ncbi:MAG TPA: hypothetical protein VD813_05605 [Pseudonocardia sp.]|nr:hypothetical protein [Pseudonocardia sp.]
MTGAGASTAAGGPSKAHADDPGHAGGPDRQTWTDTVPAELGAELRRLVHPDGLLPPWHEWFPAEVVGGLLPDPRARARICAEVPRVPLGYLQEIAPALDPWRERPCGYLRLSAGYDDAAAEARRRGWPVTRLDGHHLSAVTDPAAVAGAVLALLDRAQAVGPHRRGSPG